jgi:hypothetical protein
MGGQATLGEGGRNLAALNAFAGAFMKFNVTDYRLRRNDYGG